MRCTLLIFVLFLSGSCNEKIFTGDVDCDKCYTDRPTSADLVINLTVDNRNLNVPLVVYNGDIEDKSVVAVDTAGYSPYYIYVPVGRKYSVTAEYNLEGKKVFAVDGTNLKVLSVSDACDDKCYVIENEKIDVRIKNDFP